MNSALIFDMDGTIFQSNSIVLKAFRETFAGLAQRKLYEGPVPTDEVLLSTLGKLIPDIWKQLLPDQPDETRIFAASLMGEIENTLLESGEGQLYPGVPETLQFFYKEGWRMYIASNGSLDYLQAIVHHTAIQEYFSGIYASMNKKTSNKTELIRLLLKENEINPAFSVIIGDRHFDITAGKDLNIRTIGCSFGYGNTGELEGADILVSNFAEIAEALNRLKMKPVHIA